jgi:hypothetical protein
VVPLGEETATAAEEQRRRQQQSGLPPQARRLPGRLKPAAPAWLHGPPGAAGERRPERGGEQQGRSGAGKEAAMAEGALRLPSGRAPHPQSPDVCRRHCRP